MAERKGRRKGRRGRAAGGNGFAQGEGSAGLFEGERKGGRLAGI